MAVWRFGIVNAMPFTSETAKLHRGPGGRKRKDPKQVQEAKRMASEIAREYIEKHIDPVLSNYLKLAQGWKESRYTLSGFEYEVFRYDSRTTCHFIDKLIPDGNQAQDNKAITVNIGIVAGHNAGPELRADSLSIRLNGSNGKNGNGEHSS